MERRLAAIFAADVVSYSRLIRVNEEVTIASWRTLQTDIIEPVVGFHGGRIVKLMGDGVLAEFASVVAAVRCAIAVQTGVFEREEDQPEDMRIVLRIGVNLGDVVIEDDDVFGDGVNLAVRFEGLAPPGGICISDSVYEQIRDRLDERFTDLGEQTFKNIARPLRVWCWQPVGAAPAVANRVRTSQTERPVLTVSPFKNLSDDAEQAYLAEGLYDDVLTGLLKVPALRVMSSNDASSGSLVDEKTIAGGRGLTAQFRLEGSIRKAGRRTRVTAQLIELRSGNRVWAERFDREIDDAFELQDDVVASLVHPLGAADGVIEKAARRSTVEKSTDRASASLNALNLDSEEFRAHWVLGGIYLHDGNHSQSIAEFDKALQINPNDAHLLAWSAEAFVYSGLLGEASSRCDRAVSFREVDNQNENVSVSRTRHDRTRALCGNPILRCPSGRRGFPARHC